MTHGLPRSFNYILLMMLFLLTSSLSLSGEQSYAAECEALSTCDVLLGTGTRLEQQELIHDTRSLFEVTLNCSLLTERSEHNTERAQSKISLQFGDSLNLTAPLQGNYVQFQAQLDPWKWGLLLITTNSDCIIYQRYLVTGYPADGAIDWTCTVESAASSEGSVNRSMTSCLLASENSSAEAASHTVVCRYAVKQLQSLTAVGRQAVTELALRIEAEHVIEDADENSTGSRHDRMSLKHIRVIKMACEAPDDAAAGQCWTCWQPSSADNLLSTRHVTALTVTNLLGGITTRLSFVTIDHVVLKKPKALIQDSSYVDKGKSLSFLFDPTKEQEQFHLCIWNNSVEYAVHLQSGEAGFDSPSPKVVNQVMQSIVKVKTCSCNCCDKSAPSQDSRNASCDYCGVIFTNLTPATEYYYEAKWRILREGYRDDRGRWSDSLSGHFVTSESAPAAAPEMAPEGFEYHDCADSCDVTLSNSTTSCLAVTVYWRDMAPAQKNGRLIAFNVRVLGEHADELHAARIPSSRRSYTICHGSTWRLQVVLSAATAIGQSPASTVSINGVESLLPPISNIVVRRNRENAVDLWWSYAEPVDSFILLWRTSDDSLRVLNWLTLNASTLRPAWQPGKKWHYSLMASTVGAKIPLRALIYGIGALYNGGRSGLTTARCATYAGKEAPAAEVSEEPSTLLSTSIRLQVRVQWDGAESCSFAGPLKGFDVKVTDEIGNFTHEVTCKGCGSDSEMAFQNLNDLFHIQVNDLIPNHNYLIAVRTVVDAGATEVVGPSSKLVRARTSGLKISEAVGVAIASLIFCGILLLATLLVPQCHRAIGFGQRVDVQTIKPDDDMPGPYQRTGRNSLVLDYETVDRLLPSLTLKEEIGDYAKHLIAESTCFLELVTHDNCFDTDCLCKQHNRCCEGEGRQDNQMSSTLPKASDGVLHLLTLNNQVAEDWTGELGSDSDQQGQTSSLLSDVNESSTLPTSTDLEYAAVEVKTASYVQAIDEAQMEATSMRSSIFQPKMQSIDHSINTRLSASSDLGYWQLNNNGELLSAD